MTRLRLIQCGVGGFGLGWWKTATSNSPDFDLVAIVDVNDKPLHEAGNALGIPRDSRFNSLNSALDVLQADAVLTVTPPQVHLEHARLALPRGLHLLTEKPIAPDLAGATEMVELARRFDRQLVVSQNYRYASSNAQLRTILAEKRLGEIGHGHIDFYIPADFPGTFRQSMQFPLLIDMAIHHLDLIRAITGRNIIRVTANSFRPAWSWFDHQPALKMLLELEDGIHFSYSGDWTAHGKCTSWNGTWRIQCSDGSIHYENDRITLDRCDRWNKNPSSEPIEIPQLQLTTQQQVLSRFAQAIRTGAPAETSGQDNLQSFAAVMAAVQSAQQCCTIDVANLVRS